MSACLYECEVMHRRLRPAQKRFDYRVFMLSFDLEDLPGNTFLGINRFNLFSLNSEDHVDLGKPGGIRPNLMAWFEEQGIDCPDDARIQLITLPRVLGYTFNPVSFYYVCDNHNTPLFAVAEVCNTYREMKLYLIDNRTGTGWRRKVEKGFYVSPFSSVCDFFDFKLGLPAGSWDVTINNLDSGGLTLTSSIRGIARPLTTGRLLWFGFKYPLLSLKVIAMIHWQAMKLWLRKVPHSPKAKNKHAQTDVLRPHSSLTSKDE
ncbi:DUF1365 domain-containing protein [Akkermansiaceae bacterium]|nr:DUF1365 domain-containing protein [bacterium]MDA7933677.1 DUF1365 domain-containing protein [Akkermansiaceae bacterium]MDB4502200.1 DUF1365 domain-containing protein [Akkermansiaceae bacterium]MDB4509537.1 DUF1365 domain-containing protein [Akkermansiaceae bacterium]MDB4572573.1 DUF1365 domain-containing protein [Akkermansiaceae bacterium]